MGSHKHIQHVEEHFHQPSAQTEPRLSSTSTSGLDTETEPKQVSDPIHHDLNTKNIRHESTQPREQPKAIHSHKG